MPTSCARWFIAASLVVVPLGLTGCDTGPKLFPIEGQVKLDGKPLEFGSILVIPDKGRPAFSELDSEGRFKLWTDDKVGCVSGTHTVTIGSQKAISETVVRRYAPPKYDNGISSDAKLTVDGPKSDVVIELKGDGKSYPMEIR